jgi:hypothetical protein
MDNAARTSLLSGVAHGSPPYRMSIPIVPYSAFCSLAGEVLADELAGLMAKGEFSELVLFSDAHGMRLALLAVGEGKRHASLAEVVGIEIDGLRALCAVRPGAEGGMSSDENLSERAKEMARMEQSLKSREAYIAECEQRLAEVGHNLSEREAMLEQREQVLADKEREFFRRQGDAKRAAGSASVSAVLLPPAPRADF